MAQTYTDLDIDYSALDLGLGEKISANVDLGTTSEKLQTLAFEQSAGSI